MIEPELRAIIEKWQLPESGTLLGRIDSMIQSALMDARFGSSPTLIVGGVQYHLGSERDTKELASLAALTHEDHVLDVCCFLGGPATQLAQSIRCRVTGIDRSERCILAASRIAVLSGLADLVDFYVADAANLPFEDGHFTVVWNQGSLDHGEAWLREFDRVLAPRGRLALTFAIRGRNPVEDSPRWTLQDVVRLVEDLGYTVHHAEDITERDVEIGWRALDRKLSAREEEYAEVLGWAWVRRAHEKFAREIRTMRDGRWGNGRLVATKK